MNLAIITTPDRIEKDRTLFKESLKYSQMVVYTSIDSIKLRVGERMEVRYSGYNLSEFDYVLTIPTVEKREFFYILLRMLENSGVMVPISSDKFFIIWNRPLMLKALSKRGIHVRKTFAIAQNIVADTILRDLKLPVVITTTSGKRVYVNKMDVLKDVLSLFRPGHMVVVEKPITPESVIWSFVIGDEIVASYERRGEVRRSIVLDKEMEEIAIKVRRIFDADFCVVNFIKMKRGFIVNNVTLTPDFELFYKVTGKNVCSMLASYIMERVERERSLIGGFIKGIYRLSRWFEDAISNIRSVKKRV